MKRMKNVVPILLVLVIVCGVMISMKINKLPELYPNQYYDWVVVDGGEIFTMEEGYSWACKNYPLTKEVGFRQWKKAVESKNMTQSIADGLIYSENDIYLQDEVLICVVVEN